MKIRIFLLLPVFIWLQASQGSARSNNPTTVTVRSTSIVERSTIGGLQICQSDIEVTVAGAYTLEVFIPDDRKVSINVQVTDRKTITFRIPVLEKETIVMVRLLHSGVLVAREEITLQPPKKWTVYDVQVSHHDLGYADYYHMMRRDVREWGIELALESCRKTDDWPKESRFHWTVETSEPMTGFLQNRPDSIIAELTRRIREGRIELGGLHNSVSTEHMSYEVLARAFYTPNRYIVDWMGIPPARTALDTDVVGFIRSLPLFTKEADIPYFMMGINSTVIAFDQACRDAAYYWQAQDQDKKMTLFKTWPYYSPDRLGAYNADEVGALIGRYELRKDYPYGCILAEDSYDFGLPEMTNVEKIRDWNNKYSNPKLVSGTFSMFFDDISSQKNLKDFTTYDLDAPNAWADEDLADAKLESDARDLGYRIPATEKLATFVTAVGGGLFPWSDLWQSYNRLLMYHEHTNGAYAEGPIYVPPSLNDSTAANANYYEVEQEMHRSLVSECRNFLKNAEAIGYEGLKKLIPTGKEVALAVYNPLNYTRNDVVSFTPPEGMAGWQLIDNTTGGVVPCQEWHPGIREVMFIARDVPQAGYKTYSFKRVPDAHPSTVQTIKGETVLENRFYRIIFDPITGGINSITDKELNRELVDQEAPSKFNEYLYQRFETTRYSAGPVTYTPTGANLICSRGKLASRMLSEVKATGSENILQEVILYNDIRRIDFVLNLGKLPSGRSLADYRQGNARNKEALFYCLPFSVPGFTIRHELPGAVVEPIADQFNGSSTDYYGIQHFTDLSNGEFGVTLATVDAPLVEYGKPRVAAWSRGDDYEHDLKKPENSRVYLYLLNNMFFTNIRMSQPGKMTFRWSVRSHAGDWKTGQAPRFGWETSHPLEAILLPARNPGPLPADRYSFLRIDRENVACSAVKPAEANGTGIVLRFFELTGERTTVKAELNFIGKVLRANETNLVEADRDIPVPVSDHNQITFTIAPHGIKTIRIVAEETATGAPRVPEATGLSDRQVRLTWDKPETGGVEVAYYRIYRGNDPDFATDLRHYAGATAETSFTDQPVLNYGGWINQYVEPGTNYFYKICPVSRGNIQGPSTESLSGQSLTTAEKDLPPARVEGLHVVHVSPITSDNYLCLFFHSNIESDVTGYRIYRSKQIGFIPSEANLIGTIDASQRILHTTPHGFNAVERSLSEFTMQMYADERVEPNQNYSYRVCAVDRAGNAGEYSEEVPGRATLSNLLIEGNRFFFEGGTMVSIKPAFSDGTEIRYTLDGSLPTRQSLLYTGPVNLAEACKLRAGVFYHDSRFAEALSEATFATSLYPAPEYHSVYGARWAGSGIYNLVDGQRGGFWNDGFWQGFEFNNLDVTIDLGRVTKVSEASLGTIQFLASWIFLPEEAEFFLSADGNDFISAGKAFADPALERAEDVTHEYTVHFEKQPVRFVRVVAKNRATCPDWHLGAGGKAWIFADEVSVK